jgi:hypothetical protein
MLGVSLGGHEEPGAVQAVVDLPALGSAHFPASVSLPLKRVFYEIFLARLNESMNLDLAQNCFILLCASCFTQYCKPAGVSFKI